MAEDFDRSDKTELPTERRRQELRERGHIARSVDLNAASSVLVAAAVLNFFGDNLAQSLLDILRNSLSARAWLELDTPLLMTELLSMVRTVASALLPALALVMVSAVAVNAAQVGFVLTTEPLTPDFERINPLAGARRLWSLRSTVRLLAGLLKLAVSCAIVIGFIGGRLPQLLHGINADTAGFCQQLGSWLAALAFQMALGLVALAVLDYAFQRWKFEQDIKMTRQEIRDELRLMEGDPHNRERRRETHRKLIVARQIHESRNGDVVITDATHLAIAIKYNPKQMTPPVILAKGKDQVAAQIRRMAAEHGIPIVEKARLAQILCRAADAGQPIPAEAFEPVAEILACAERLRRDSTTSTLSKAMVQ
jgi:flagellar biosynthetic protein FlhB